MDRWLGKPYYSLNAYFQNTYGKKLYKIAVDAGLTCPNRDGTLDSRGCIFCADGSGSFAVSLGENSVREQIRTGMAQCSKAMGEAFVIYFQAYTNTYGSLSYLREIFTEALQEPLVMGISIATRPDCLPEEVLDLLTELKDRYAPKFIWVELGLQTIHPKTAEYIRRGYPLSVYEEAARNLTRRGIPFITHVILGLPGEDRQAMLETVSYLNGATAPRPFGVKLQLLHVLKGTDLADEYEKGAFSVLSQEEYLDILCACITGLHPEIVLHRVTGDGPKALLVAPLWSANKKAVLNAFHKKLREEKLFQGQNAD